LLLLAELLVGLAQLVLSLHEGVGRPGYRGTYAAGNSTPTERWRSLTRGACGNRTGVRRVTSVTRLV